MTNDDVLVERELLIDADLDDVWDHVVRTSTEQWLGTDPDFTFAVGATTTIAEPDGTRSLLVTGVDRDDRGGRITWHWCDDEGELSSVEVTVTTSDDGTVVKVVEALAHVPGAASLSVIDSAFAGPVTGRSGRVAIGWDARLRRLATTTQLCPVA